MSDQPTAEHADLRTIRTLQAIYATLGEHGMPGQREVYAQVAETLRLVLVAPSDLPGSPNAGNSDLRGRLRSRIRTVLEWRLDGEAAIENLAGAALDVVQPVLDRQATEIDRLNTALDYAKNWIKDWSRDNELLSRERREQQQRAERAEAELAVMRAGRPTCECADADRTYAEMERDLTAQLVGKDADIAGERDRADEAEEESARLSVVMRNLEAENERLRTHLTREQQSGDLP